ncbi:hypothetical protein CQ019_12885 [Arthrobacter sp. MYb229]|nr:hypothetical protein CQ019_12885 [Arthrobacter sp. MYb229]PRB50698.1 hypothetical protein CQ013_11940 [Arthrobacter sp. MYb216]
MDQREPLPAVQELVDEAADSLGIGAMHEDYVPMDPTNVATVRVGDELLRYVPGLVERPIADLSRALRLAAAVDHRLMWRYKFGIANVVRVALKYVDFCLRSQLESWEPAPDIRLSDAISIPANELTASRKLLSQDPLDSLQLEPADLLALEWMTAPASSVKFDHESPTSPFGRALRYRNKDADQHDRWLPPTYVPEVLAHAVSELVGGLNRDKHARRALRASYIEATRRALWRFSKTLIEAPPRSLDEMRPLAGSEIHWLVPVDGVKFIAVSILYAEDLPQAGSPSIACVRLAEQIRAHNPSKGPISTKLAGDGNITLLPGATVVPLIIVAGTSHLMSPQMPGQATMALEDLTWIAETATADDDLYRFARDLSSPDFPSSFGWEAINYWEPWKANGKTFFKGGISPTHMHFEAHAGDAEWERAVALSSLESALYGTGLPALRNAEMAESSSGNVASVAFDRPGSKYDIRRGTHHAPESVAWTLALTTPPIAIVRSDPDWTSGQEHQFFFDVCGGLVFAFVSIGESWRNAHKELDVPGYRLGLRSIDGQIGPAEGVVDFSPSMNIVEGATRVATWGFDVEGFVEEADGNPHAANILTVASLEQLLEYGGNDFSIAQEIGKEWLTRGPFLILETKLARTKLQRLPNPWAINQSDQSAATASFARRLHSAGVQPGRYSGEAANSLVQEHLAPTALKELNDRIAMHDTQMIIDTGMEQLNRVVDHLQYEQENLTRVVRNLVTEWDPITRMTDLASESFEIRQSNEIIVEAALRSQSNAGTDHPVTHQSWSALLAAAEAYRAMTLLSEGLHHRVTRTTIDISSTYELTFQHDECATDDSWVLESEAFNTAAASIRLAPTIDGDVPSADRVNDAIDLALLESFGVSTFDLFLTLQALAQWETFGEYQSIAFASEEEAVS